VAFGKNLIEWNDSIPDFDNVIASLHVWRKEQSRSEFLFGWTNVNAESLLMSSRGGE
jgi:hypothetical protein